MNIIEREAKKILTKFVRAGGQEVSEAEYEARVNTCRTRQNGNPCEFLGPVNAAGIVFSEGCILCGCPLETKARMQEMNGIHATFLGHEIKCPHPEMDFWAQHKQA